MHIWEEERLRSGLAVLRLDAVADATGIAKGRLRRFSKGRQRHLYSDEAALLTRFFEGLTTGKGSGDDDE